MKGVTCWTERGWVCGIGMRKRLILFQKPCFYVITDRVLSRGAIAGFLLGTLELDIIQDLDIPSYSKGLGALLLLARSESCKINGLRN